MLFKKKKKHSEENEVMTVVLDEWMFWMRQYCRIGTGYLCVGKTEHIADRSVASLSLSQYHVVFCFQLFWRLLKIKCPTSMASDSIMTPSQLVEGASSSLDAHKAPKASCVDNTSGKKKNKNLNLKKSLIQKLLINILRNVVICTQT